MPESPLAPEVARHLRFRQRLTNCPKTLTPSLLRMEISDPISAVLAHKPADIWTIGPHATVYEAIELMAKRNVGALPVVSREELVGLISEREYTRRVVLEGKSSKTTPVHEIMIQRVVCIHPEDPVEKGMQLVTDKRVRHLPVLDDGKLVGIVSIGDLVNWMIAAQDTLIRQLENYIDDVYPV